MMEKTLILKNDAADVLDGLSAAVVASLELVVRYNLANAVRPSFLSTSMARRAKR